LVKVSFVLGTLLYLAFLALLAWVYFRPPEEMLDLIFGFSYEQSEWLMEQLVAQAGGGVASTPYPPWTPF
jgi:hypothetical protein